jgi:sugar lactone lactonase YvrE
MIVTVAGVVGSAPAVSDGAPGKSGALGNPLSAVFDAHGNVVFADQDNNVIRVEAASNGTWYGQPMTAGHIYTVVGTSAGLLGPSGVAVDARGDLAITDTGNNTVDFVPATTGSYYGIGQMNAGQVYPIANGVTSNIVDGGFAYSAGLNFPDGVAFDAQGDVVVADTGNNMVRLIPAAARTVFGRAVHTHGIYTITGNANNIAYSGDAGRRVAAGVSLLPFTGVAADPHGNVVIADGGNSVVRVVAANSGVFYQKAMTAGDIYTIAGDGNPGLKNNKKATRGEMDTPQGVAVDGVGNVLVSDAVNNDIRVIPARSGRYLGIRVKGNGLYNIAGNGNVPPGYGGDGGSPKSAVLNAPAGLSADPFGHVIIADNGNNVLREITNSVPTLRPAVPARRHLHRARAAA